MDVIEGVVQSKSRKGNSIKVNDEWYSCYSPSDLAHVNWKDSVEFKYVMKGEYRNIKGEVKKLSAESSGGGSTAQPWSNIGVEIGHASNLAMRMMEQQQALEGDLSTKVGSPEYFQEFTLNTLNVYKVMKAIRSKVESVGGVVPTAVKPEAEEPSEKMAEPNPLEDIF